MSRAASATYLLSLSPVPIYRFWWLVGWLVRCCCCRSVSLSFSLQPYTHARHAQLWLSPRVMLLVTMVAPSSSSSSLTKAQGIKGRERFKGRIRYSDTHSSTDNNKWAPEQSAIIMLLPLLLCIKMSWLLFVAAAAAFPEREEGRERERRTHTHPD